MMNQLYRQYNQPTNIIDRFRQFQQNFKGDPQQIVQQMVSSGRISQDQLNQAVRMANELKKYIR